MAHDVSVMGAVYREVPSVMLPDQNGTLNQFTDVSDTTATAADVAKGAYFYTSDGVRTAGTSEGGGGGGESDSGDRTDPIRFFDYDGRLVASYKAVPSAMPDVPTHDRLTNGTWNYTLEQVAEQFGAVGKCDVGANYDTASGKTEIDVTLDSAHLDPYLCVAVNGTVTVDWGDGSATDTIKGTSWTVLYPKRHVYVQAGNYTISIDGAVAFYSNSNAYPTVLRGHDLLSGDRQRDSRYCNCVTAIRVADGSRIGDYAFSYCRSLLSVTIPSSVTSIGKNVFYNCYSLLSVTIPSSVTSIGNNTFTNCHSLMSVTIPSSVTSIATYAFSYCRSLLSVTIPSSVTSIAAYAFYSCESLQSVTVPPSVTSINIYVFYNCYSLLSVTIPSSVTSIGNDAFDSCYSLRSVTIPSSVTSIGRYAFSYCYGTYEYHIEPTTPPTLGATYNFNGIQSGTIIYVPKGCLETYQTASNWSSYKSYMQEEA